MNVNIGTCSFMDYAFGVMSKNFLPNSRSQILYPIFSLGSFTLLGFTYRFMIFFELIFVYGYRVWIKVHFFLSAEVLVLSF